MSGIFDRDSELESIYLVGNFGVSTTGGTFEGAESGMSFYRYQPSFKLIKLPEVVHSGDLSSQGLPFFAGSLKLSQSIAVKGKPEKAKLTLDHVKTAVARVYLNGSEVGVTAWPPFEVSLGKGLQPGQNLLEIELANTLRNLLGPHHLSGGDPVGVGPDSFRASPRWTNDYILAPFGLAKVRLNISHVE